MGQDKEITDVQHLVADSIPSDMINDYMSEKYEEIKQYLARRYGLHREVFQKLFTLSDQHGIMKHA